MVVDGIDFRIKEPLVSGFNPHWFSHKFSGPGIRYEVASCIRSGKIVWINGPYPAGRFNDLAIYRLGLKAHLRVGERVWGDLGYRGELTIVTKFHARSSVEYDEIQQARSRHENINGRLAAFGALHQCWRHDRNKHYLVVNAAAVIYNIECTLWGPHFSCFATQDPAV